MRKQPTWKGLVHVRLPGADKHLFYLTCNESANQVGPPFCLWGNKRKTRRRTNIPPIKFKLTAKLDLMHRKLNPPPRNVPCQNMTCRERGRALVLLIVLPETQVAVFCSLARACCRRNRKWRVLGPSVDADPPADQEAGHGFKAQVLCLAAGHFPV